MIVICFGVGFPVLFIIYNIIYYFKKKVIYTIKSEDFVIVSDDFFKIQLYLSCINAMLISIIVFVWGKFDSQYIALPVILTFWGINYLIKYISRIKKYVG